MSSTRGELAARTFAALVHHPVYNRSRRIVTTAITNLDIHDLARSSRTYGLAGYFLVTPIEAQRELATRIVGHWRAPAAAGPENICRREALQHVAVCASIDEARARIAREAGQEPLTVATAARPGDRRTGYAELAGRLTAEARPVLLLFGTGWGLADEVLDRVDHVLAPILGQTDYNHLSVRSAAAIVFDRLFGDRPGGGEYKELESHE